MRYRETVSPLHYRNAISPSQSSTHYTFLYFFAGHDIAIECTSPIVEPDGRPYFCASFLRFCRIKLFSSTNSVDLIDFFPLGDGVRSFIIVFFKNNNKKIT